MGSKNCIKCDQVVDDAKAFCPYCSYSFDMELEAPASEFELTRNTDTFTQSFFNEVLSEMDLNISEPSDAPARSAVEPVNASRRNRMIWIGAVFVFLVVVVIAILMFLILR